MLIEAGLLLGLANDLKIIGSILTGCSLLFGVFKVINWIKTKFINIDANVTQLKDSMDKNLSGLRQDIKEQTKSITDALSEQRQDFRTFYAPTLLHMQSQFSTPPVIPARAKKVIKKPKK